MTQYDSTLPVSHVESPANAGQLLQNSVDPDPRASEKDDRFWQNFEAEAPNLFVSEDSLCDAGVLEYVAQKEQCSPSRVSACYQPMDRIKSASGLKRALEVSTTDSCRMKAVQTKY